MQRKYYWIGSRAGGKNILIVSLLQHTVAYREQGWGSGESTCLPQIWPGFDYLTSSHTWTEFIGSLLCSERFFPFLIWFDLL